MPVRSLILVAAATAMALITLGGGLYEYAVVDSAWPARPDIIMPSRGGLLRRNFWGPVHSLFEILLLISLAVLWFHPTVRVPLLVAFVAHAINRIWSLTDFIPKALAFEQADPDTVTEQAGLRWIRRSKLRLPLELTVSTAMIVALIAAARLAP
jgi:hypothetical protein